MIFFGAESLFGQPFGSGFGRECEVRETRIPFEKELQDSEALNLNIDLKALEF